MARLSIIDLKKNFGDIDILKGISLEIQDREFICFLGPSGCGKSTLLRCIAGLEDIDGGQIVIDDQIVNDVPPAERDLAMVFQSYALYPHMNVRKNMSFGLSLRKFKKAEIDKRIADAARILQLEALLDRKPKQLSGGQRQRVAIGRAIVRQPRIFLFDEPLSNLDAALRANTRVEIARLHRQLEATMIYVTHDQVEAMTLADKVVVMNAGKLVQFGRPLELYHRPSNRFVAGFIGSPNMNFLDVSVDSLDEQGRLQVIHAGTKIRTPHSPEQAVRNRALCLGIRPEHLSIQGNSGKDKSGGDATLRGLVILIERLGAESLVFVNLDSGDNITISVDGMSKVKNGDQVQICVDTQHIHLFDEAGLALPRPLPPEVEELF